MFRKMFVIQEFIGGECSVSTHGEPSLSHTPCKNLTDYNLTPTSICTETHTLSHKELFINKKAPHCYCLNGLASIQGQKRIHFVF